MKRLLIALFALRGAILTLKGTVTLTGTFEAFKNLLEQAEPHTEITAKFTEVVLTTTTKPETFTLNNHEWILKKKGDANGNGWVACRVLVDGKPHDPQNMKTGTVWLTSESWTTATFEVEIGDTSEKLSTVKAPAAKRVEETA